MPSIDFGVRLIFDESFYEIEIKKSPSLLRKLMYINARAQGHKRRFNILPRKIFNKILENNPTMSKELLKCSFYGFEEETLELIDCEIELVVKYAIELIKEEPQKKFIILTSAAKEKEYLENPHFKDSKDVSIRSGEEAIKIIEEFWDKCTIK